MTTTQPSDGAVNITVNSTDVTTNTLRNLQWRLEAFQREFELNKHELLLTKQAIANASEDYAALNRDLLAEREARTNAQIERDAVKLKLIAYRTLLQRLVNIDEVLTDEAYEMYSELIEDVKAALEVQS